jgi:glucose/arabinose dehydrogenase
MTRVLFNTCLAAGLLEAATLPSGFTEAQIATGISNPTAMEFAPDGRLFVCQQGGQLRVIKNGALLPTPFLTVVVNSTGERGLLGVAFDPNFASNQFVYVYYTATTPSVHNRVSRFTAVGDVAVTGSEAPILDLENLSATNHNGGAIHFGPDGMLYVAVGENAVGSNAQTLTNRLGKMLRIAPDGSIPSDNPFFGTAAGLNRSIWALGLRNPYTFAFQAGTGRLFINDVGQNTWEEINDGISGSNYGWPTTEGATTNPSFRTPLYAYNHSSGTCAITGGTFYNPSTSQFPSDYTGAYLFADHCAGWIKRFNPGTGAVVDFASGIASPVDLTVSTGGDLYYLARGSGAVWRVRFTGSQTPVISAHPQNTTVSVGQQATFNVSASGSAPLSYQWQRNSVPISGATSSSYTLAGASLSDSGAQFRCVVSNTLGSATSNFATLTVVSNQAPAATILTPAAGTLYIAGQSIAYSGIGTDPEDGALQGSTFTWRIDFHHDTHVHPFLNNLTGASGSFVIPNTGETSASVYYRIYLTVRDSGGVTRTTFRDIQPQTVRIKLVPWPTNFQLKLDDQPANGIISFTGVAGMVRKIEAVSPQVWKGRTYVVQSWSDGGAATHTIVTPTTNSVYRAVFVAQ